MDEIAKKFLIALSVVIIWICVSHILTRTDISCDNRLGAGYKYYSEQKAILSWKGGIIPPEIIEYNYGRKHIVVAQKPRSLLEIDKLYFDDLPSNFSYPNGLAIIYYWIIDKKTKVIYGPMLKEEFLSMSDSLGVKPKLKFDKDR